MNWWKDETQFINDIMNLPNSQNIYSKSQFRKDGRKKSEKCSAPREISLCSVLLCGWLMILFDRLFVVVDFVH